MVWQCCMLVLSLYIGAPSLCRAVGRAPADYHQDAGFQFACSSHPNVSPITLYTEETVERLQEKFSNFVENDDAKAVIFWLDFQKYEGVNPMLYNLTRYYGLWTWTWVYDEYGKTLLRFSIQAEYLSFGLLHRNVETMHIKFDNRTKVSDIAHLQESCKFDLGVTFLTTIINVQDKQDEDNDNCLCSRYLELTQSTFYKISKIMHKCCCYPQSQLVENVTYCNIETIQDTKWITYSKIILYIFVIIFEYFIGSSLHWRLLFHKSQAAIAKFKTPSQTDGEFEIDQTELIDCSEKSKVSIIELVSCMKQEQDDTNKSCFKISKTDSCSRVIAIWRYFYTSFVAIVLVPIGLWIPLLASLMYPKSRKEEIHAWEQFNDDYLTEDTDMVLSFDGTYVSNLLIVFAIAMTITITHILFDIIWNKHRLQCITHPFTYKTTDDLDTSDMKLVCKHSLQCTSHPFYCKAINKTPPKNIVTCKHSLRSKEHPFPCGKMIKKTPDEANAVTKTSSADNLLSVRSDFKDDVSHIYETFLSSNNKLEDCHVYDNMHSLGAKLHIQVFRKGIINSYKKLCGIPPKFCLSALLLLGLYIVTAIVSYIVIPFYLLYNILRQVSTDISNKKLLAAVILMLVVYIQVVCITISFINFSIFGAFLLSGFVLNIESMAQPAIFFVTLFMYIFTEYKNVIQHYNNLKIATYKECKQYTDDADSTRQPKERTNCWADFVTHKSDKEHDKAKSPDKQQEEGKNLIENEGDGNKNRNILIFRDVPFVESLRWQDCISRDLFSHICKNVSPISSKLVSIMLRLIAVTLFLLLVFFVVKSFGKNPLKSSVLAFAVGIIPVLEQYRKKREDNEFLEGKKAKDIALAVERYLQCSNSNADNNKDGKQKGVKADQSEKGPVGENLQLQFIDERESDAL